MAQKPRIKLPKDIKAGDIIEVKALTQHVMETGNRKDGQGSTIPRNIIHTFKATFEGQQVFSANLGSGIAANPYLAFHMRVPGPGELEVTWIDDGGVTVVKIEKIDVLPAKSQ